MRESLLEDSLDNRLTLSFLAEMADVSEYVQRRMDATPTLSGDHLLQMAAWSAFAPANTPWTATVLKQLSEMFLSEAQFPLLRDRAAAALIASRDSRVPRVFETGMVNSVQSVRLLSTLGLGVLRDPESVPLLGKALEDEDAAVKVAATLALGAMADQPSLDYLLQNLLTGSEMSRRAVAEMLATNYGDHGIELLKEALEDEEDSSTRKAAIYGLERLGPQPWVLEILEKLERRDPELLVRTVAGTLLDRYRRNEVSGPTPPSPPHRTKWIVTWLTEKQTQPASGPDGIDQVIRILSEGGPAEQLGAVELLGALGVADAISPLYDALRNSHEEIRDSAYRALNATGRTLGIQLPGLI
jgi:HEAT repeat protein